MEASTSIDALDPKRSHIALLVSAISVRILQRLIDPFSGDPDAILGATPETFGEFKDLLFVRTLMCFFPPISTRAHPLDFFSYFLNINQNDDEKV
jgi:hypothetical protein